MYDWPAHVVSDHERRRRAVATLLAKKVPTPLTYDDAFRAIESALVALRIALRHCHLTPADCAMVDVTARQAILQCVREAKHHFGPE